MYGLITVKEPIFISFGLKVTYVGYLCFKVIMCCSANHGIVSIRTLWRLFYNLKSMGLQILQLVSFQCWAELCFYDLRVFEKPVIEPELILKLWKEIWDTLPKPENQLPMTQPHSAFPTACCQLLCGALHFY